MTWKLFALFILLVLFSFFCGIGATNNLFGMQDWFGVMSFLSGMGSAISFFSAVISLLTDGFKGGRGLYY